MIAYLDTSVILRVILAESAPLPEWSAIEQVVTSAITEVECLRTIDRIRLHQGVSETDLAVRRESVFELLTSLTLIEVTPIVLARAALPLPVTIRTLDALHLASAQLWREQSEEDLLFATHDAAQARAARSLGFHVIGGA